MDKSSGITRAVLSIGATGLFLVFLFAYKYVSWSQTSHYFGTSHYGAREPLMWIQSAQEKYLAQRGTYCSSIRELLQTDLEGDGRDKVAFQVGTDSADGTGFPYQYSIETGEGVFEAKARCCSSQARGEDLWTIGPEGAPVPVVQSSTKADLPYASAVGVGALACLAAHIYLLCSTAFRYWRKSPSPQRVVGGLGLVVAGVLTPLILLLVLLS
jgi:hypothetical protein